MNQSLYVIANEYHAMVERLMDSELDEQTIKDTLEGASGELEVKATNVAMFIRNLESSAEQIKLAEKAMAERRKALENKADSVKRYLFDNMKRVGVTKIESPYFALTIKKNPPSVIIDDESLIDDGFKRMPEPLPLIVDKALIKQAIENGLTVEGAHIEQKERLEIK